MKSHTVNADGIRQFVVEEREGAPVILLHGFPELLWGNDFHAVGKLFDMASVWAEMADDLPAYPIERCGQLPQEEQPEKVNERLLKFLAGWRGK